MSQIKWWKLQKGTGIKVKIPGDIDKITGKQKIRPGIIIKSYPSHIKVQLFSTEKSKDTNFSIVINGTLQHIRPIYFRTILFIDVHSLWFEKREKVFVKKDSSFFEKIIEMQYKEIFDKSLDLSLQHKLEKYLKQNSELLDWNKELQKENEIQQLKKEVELLKNSNLKNRNRG